MAELNARLKHEDTKLAAERAQHNAAAKNLMLAQEEVLELKRRVRVAVCLPNTLCFPSPATRSLPGGVFNLEPAT